MDFSHQSPAWQGQSRVSIQGFWPAHDELEKTSHSSLPAGIPPRTYPLTSLGLVADTISKHGLVPPTVTLTVLRQRLAFGPTLA